MASFVHVTDAREATRLRLSGLRPCRYRTGRAPDSACPRGVFCVPVLPDFQATFQWLRELKRRGHRTACAVQFRLPDAEPVLAGHFAQRLHDGLEPMTAAQAVALFLRHPDPRGLEVVVPRKVLPREIVRVRALPQVVGWRFRPGAKGAWPSGPTWGEVKGARVRRRMAELSRSPLERLVEQGAADPIETG